MLVNNQKVSKEELETALRNLPSSFPSYIKDKPIVADNEAYNLFLRSQQSVNTKARIDYLSRAINRQLSVDSESAFLATLYQNQSINFVAEKNIAKAEETIRSSIEVAGKTQQFFLLESLTSNIADISKQKGELKLFIQNQQKILKNRSNS